MTTNPNQTTPAEPSTLNRAVDIAKRIDELRNERASIAHVVSAIRTGNVGQPKSPAGALACLYEHLRSRTVEHQPDHDCDGWLAEQLAKIGDDLHEQVHEALDAAEAELTKLVSPKLTEPTIYDWRRLALWGVKREVAGRSEWATVDVPTASGVSCKAIPLFLGWTDAANAINEWDALKLANGNGLYYVEAATPPAAAFDHANRRDEPASVTLNGETVEPWRANVFRQAVSDAGLAPAAAIAETPEQIGPLRPAIAVELGLTEADAAKAVWIGSPQGGRRPYKIELPTHGVVMGFGPPDAVSVTIEGVTYPLVEPAPAGPKFAALPEINAVELRSHGEMEDGALCFIDGSMVCWADDVGELWEAVDVAGNTIGPFRTEGEALLALCALGQGPAGEREAERYRRERHEAMGILPPAPMAGPEPHPAGAEFSTQPKAEPLPPTDPPLSHFSGIDEKLKAGSPEQLDQADRDQAASQELTEHRLRALVTELKAKRDAWAADPDDYTTAARWNAIKKAVADAEWTERLNPAELLDLVIAVAEVEQDQKLQHHALTPASWGVPGGQVRRITDARELGDFFGPGANLMLMLHRGSQIVGLSKPLVKEVWRTLVIAEQVAHTGQPAVRVIEPDGREGEPLRFDMFIREGDALIGLHGDDAKAIAADLLQMARGEEPSGDPVEPAPIAEPTAPADGLKWWAEVNLVPANDSDARDGHEPERVIVGPYDDRDEATAQAAIDLELEPGDSFAIFRAPADYRESSGAAAMPIDGEIVVVPALPIESALDAPTTTGAGLDVTASEGGAL